MALSIAIQHHPARGGLLRPLISALTPGPPPQVIFDPEPEARIRSPWRCYRHCLETAPAEATHRLIIQDDAIVCRDFPEAARRAVEARPDALVVFSVLGAPHRWKSAVLHAGGRRESWAELDVAFYPSWVPVIAVCWPTARIAPALSWVDEQDWPEGFVSDDAIVGKIALALGFPVWATVPSLVNHPEENESLMGRRRAPNPQRTAPCFIAPDCDALSINWN